MQMISAGAVERGLFGGICGAVLGGARGLACEAMSAECCCCWVRSIFSVRCAWRTMSCVRFERRSVKIESD